MSDNKQPRVVIGALIYNDDKKIFLAQSKKWSDRWVVPGGHLEWGESLEECVRREVREETNLEVDDIELVGIQECIGPKDFNKEKHMIFIDYSCKAVGNDVKLNDEIQEYVWVTPEEALKKDGLGQWTKVLITRFIGKGKV